MPAKVSKTDLTRRTREIVELVQRSNVVVVESYGDECIALLDMLTYHLLRAFASHGHQAESNDEDAELTEIYRLVAAYLTGEIGLEGMAEMLHISRFELLDRLGQLGILAQ